MFIDETGVNLAMTRGYGRAKKGKRAYSKCPYNRGKNVTLIGAIASLSPYSPDFNPIENCWSKIKEFLRAKEAHTYSELARAITEAINLVSDQDITGWFTHCCYYAPPN
ncbi:MAG: hypothetical protein HC820_02295 [Hydrococcus sp. RM1_1_31]|nr:hypothetical protein [Hydrococcus sp. RM1_1_31]